MTFGGCNFFEIVIRKNRKNTNMGQQTFTNLIILKQANNARYNNNNNNNNL